MTSIEEKSIVTVGHHVNSTSNKRCPTATIASQDWDTMSPIFNALKEPKILQVFLGFVDFVSLQNLRRVSKAFNQLISTSVSFLETSKLHIHGPDAVEMYNRSTVQWRHVVLGYWPQPFDLIEPENGNQAFWLSKAETLTELIIKFHPSIYLRSFDLYQILCPLTYLTSLIIGCQLTQFKFYNDLGPTGKIHLSKTFKHLTHLQFHYLPSANPECIQIHLNNCYQILRVVPPQQLKTFSVFTKAQFSTPEENRQRTTTGNFIMIGALIERGIQNHAQSLLSFRCDADMLPRTLDLIGRSEALQLTTLNLNLVSTIRFFEKSQVDNISQNHLTAIAYFQVKTWRTFVTFLASQTNLRGFELQISSVTKKILKQLLPPNVQNSLRVFGLTVERCKNEEDLRCLAKLTFLKTLTLNVNNFSIIYKGSSQSNFLPTIPSSLENLMFVSIKYPPFRFVELIQRLNLKTIRLHGASSMLTDDSIQVIIRNLHNLRNLTLSPAYQVTDTGFIGKENIRQLSRLQSLTIRDAKITNSTLRRGFWLPNLVHLDLSGCSKLSHRGILELPSQLPQLKFLQVIGIDLLPSDKKKLSTKWPKIHYVYKKVHTEVSTNRFVEPPPKKEVPTVKEVSGVGEEGSSSREAVNKTDKDETRTEIESKMTDARIQMLDILKSLTDALAVVPTA